MSLHYHKIMKSSSLVLIIKLVYLIIAFLWTSIVKRTYSEHFIKKGLISVIQPNIKELNFICKKECLIFFNNFAAHFAEHIIF